MSTASIIRVLGHLPMPVFGTAATAFAYSRHSARALPGYLPWAFPAVVGGMWFIWPAVDEEWKQSIGLGSTSAVVAAAPAAKEEVTLDDAGKAAVDSAYKAHAPSSQDAAISAQIQKGDFSSLEKEWDTFAAKAIVPGEDDDDDDEDEDEDEEDEEDDDDEDE